MIQHIKPVVAALLILMFLSCLYSPVVLACSGSGAGGMVLYSRSVVRFWAAVSAVLTSISIVLFFLRQRKGLWVILVSLILLIFHPAWFYGGGGGDCGLSMAQGAKFTSVLTGIGTAHQLRTWLIGRRQ